MAIRTTQTLRKSELELMLNGAVAGAVPTGDRYVYVVGKTLILTGPSAHTITFTDVAERPTNQISLKDICDQVATQTSNQVIAKIQGNKFYLYSSSGAVKVSGAGTANPVFGFPSSSEISGKVFSLASIQVVALNNNSYIVMYEE